jgi:hypothetical protein
MSSRSSLRRPPSRPLRDDIAALPPRRRPIIVPLALIAIVVGAVASTVMLANGGRNIAPLLQAAGPGWEKALAASLGWHDDAIPQAQQAGASPHPADAVSTSSAGFIDMSSSRIAATGADTTEVADSGRDAAAARCDRLADGTQEKPAFTAEENGRWQCTALLTFVDDTGASSLFVQIRGLDGSLFSSFRIKFNSGPTGITTTLANEAIRLAGIGLATDETPDGSADLRDRLLHEKNFDAVIGGYRATFRREASDATRGNLIILGKPFGRGAVTDGAIKPRSAQAGSADTKNTAAPTVSRRIDKSARLGGVFERNR